MTPAPRKAQPPDFRYVALAPRSSVAAVAAATFGVGVACAAFTIWSSISTPLTISVAVGASAITALTLGRGDRRFGERRVREVAMAVVPWGVIVTPDADPRVLRWPAIRKVDVDIEHAMRGGTPAILSSFVAIHTDREILAGCAAGAVNLERLVANLEAYAVEASRPPSRDLDGREPVDADATEPVADVLISCAQHICASGVGASRLALPAGGYRLASLKRATPETQAVLRAALDADLDASPADPRPIACIAAALLGADDLKPDLLRLVSSPHPLVAAFAKAAALRLGAPKSRAGSIDELAAFLSEEDLGVVRAWAGEDA